MNRTNLTETGFLFADVPNGPLRLWLLNRKEAGDLQYGPPPSWAPASRNADDIAKSPYRLRPGTELPAEIDAWLRALAGNEPEPKKSGTTPGKDAMTSNVLKLETKTFLNGTDLAALTNEQIANVIKVQKADIAELEALNEEPIARISQEIAQRKDGLAAFIAAVQQLPAR